jgi:PDZ domain-containing protein
LLQSQRTAEFVAAKAAGYDVSVDAVLFVESVTKGGPSQGKLEAGDELVSVDGKPVPTASALRTRIRAQKAGSRITVVVLRGAAGKRRTVQIRTAADPKQHGAPIIGVFLHPALEINLPPKLKISIDMGSVRGPSAGLGLALQLYQEIAHDVDRGYKVATTGTIDLDGRVGAIGGVKQKTIGARRAHIDVFLVPVDGDNAKEARRYAGGMRIIPVTTFQQALHALATLPEKGKNRQVQTGSKRPVFARSSRAAALDPRHSGPMILPCRNPLGR